MYVKEARGAMARYIIENQLTTSERLKDFRGNENEWKYDESRSDDSTICFYRVNSNKSNDSKKSNSSKPKSTVSKNVKKPESDVAGKSAVAKRAAKRSVSNKVDVGSTKRPKRT